MATEVISTFIVDAVRLTVYGFSILADYVALSQTLLMPVAVAILAAFAGSFVGKKFLHKVTLRVVQLIVTGALLLIGLLLVAGLV